MTMESVNRLVQLWIAFTLMAVLHASEFSKIVPDNASRFKLSVKPEFTYKSLPNLGMETVDSASDTSSEMISTDEDSSVQHEVTVNYPSSKSTQVSSYRIPREQKLRHNSLVHRKKKERKIRPGQYASKTLQRKTKNWKMWPEYMKSVVDPSDSNIAWTYWETEEEEPDDADDSKPTTTSKTTPSTTTTTTTTTTSTTASPMTMTTMKDKTSTSTSPVSIHKHFHYFKKAAPWTGDPWKGDKMMPTSAPAPPTMPMTMEDMMKMTDDMMEEMMMKGMMMMPPHIEPDMKKGGLSSIFEKLSKVEPITILVAGIIPASLILAAALPSVMNKMMVMKGDPNGGPMIPMISTTAIGANGMAPMEMMESRSSHGPESMSDILEAVGEFGLKALEKPHCARMMFCKLASEKLMADSPIIQRAIQFATIAMEDSWLQHVGVQSIFKSLNEGTCNQVECDSDLSGGNSVAT